MAFTGAMVVAMSVDALLGWPDPLFARIGHPVTWLAGLIDFLDKNWNRSSASAGVRRAAGAAAALIVIALAVAAASAIQSLLISEWSRIFGAGILAWPLVALRSLYDHVAAVALALQSSNIETARLAVARIVGRDPSSLDEAGIARAAIESLAENASDGVVAPVFWGALFGLPGIVGYKAINTLDSMIGHRTIRHKAFGWAAARIDDLANFVPARLTGFLFAVVAQSPSAAWSCMARDARRHRSMNAGWPEAAMAGALGVRLSGPRVYQGSVAEEPWLNEGARDPRAEDILAGLKLYRRAMILLAGALIILGLALT
ncbi:MAG TPA: adenosylcobinamide-phosphate synthase CbiB [Bradyrhizobium sp.]|nr:adenosylcobinamide-phosphate synthase CbiB [Bradyrhizobium sp.]